jgi:hypothetical protein
MIEEVVTDEVATDSDDVATQNDDVATSLPKGSSF